MKVNLVFPPRSNSTYVPLGISTLKAYLYRHNPDVDVRLHDLSITAWQWLLKRVPDAGLFREFLADRDGSFYDFEKYTHLRTLYWNPLSREYSVLCTDAKVFVETNRLSPFLEEFLEYIVPVLAGNSPDIIGFSVMYPRQCVFSLALSRYIKKKVPGVTIVLGGASISSIDYSALLRYAEYIDYIVDGEGETALDLLCRKTPSEKIPGLVYRHNGKIRHNNRIPSNISLKNLPVPDFSWADFSLYFNPEPVLPVFFSRSCAWRKCRFCAHNFSFGSYRTKGVSRFVDELEYYRTALGVRHFYIVDQYITPKDILKISAEIRRRGLDLFYHFMGRPSDELSAADFREMYNAGCRWISWGVETGSQKLLDIVNKGTNVEGMKKVLYKTKQAGISNLLMMIFGLPGSDDTELQHTFDFLGDVSGYIDALTESEFVLYDSTYFGRNAKKFGLKKTAREELCRINDNPVYTDRVEYRLLRDGEELKPRGPYETGKLDNVKKMSLDIKPFHSFNAEHFLLYTVNTGRETSSEGRNGSG